MAVDFPLKVSLAAVDRLTAPMARAQSRIRRLFAPIGALNARFRLLGRTAGLPAVAAGLGGVGRSLGGVGRELGSLVRKFGLLGAAGVGAAVGLVVSFAKAGDSIAKTATRLGIGVEALQEWRFAADRSGVGAATFDMALQRFGRRAAEAAMGTGEARVALKALGVQLTDSTGKMRPVDDLLGEVADSLAKVESPLVRNALAMKLFDSEGVKLVQLLKDGNAPVQALREEARRLGLVMGEDAARGAERFVDAQTNLSAALTGVKNRIGGVLLPVLQPLLERFTEFVVDVGPKVQAFAESFMEKLPGRLQLLKTKLLELKETFQPFIDIGAWIVRTFGPVNTLLGGLAVVVGAQLVVAVGSLVGAVAALNVALGATPVGWIILALAGLVASVYLVMRHWGAIKDFFIRIWDGVVGAFRGAFEWAKEHVPGFSGFVDGIIAAWGKLAPWFEDLWEGIKERFRTSIRWMSEKIDQLAQFLPDWLREDLGLRAPTITVDLKNITKGIRAFDDFRARMESAPIGARLPDLSRAFPRLAPSGAPRAPSGAGGNVATGLNLSGLRDALTRVRVEFENMPAGGRAKVVSTYGPPVELEVRRGFGMLTP